VTFASGLQTALFGPLQAPLAVRLSRILLAALLIGVGVDQVVSAVGEWPLHDMDTYLAAAIRLRSGVPLYEADVAYNAYWYAPWFAVAWIPFSYLPREVIAIGWSAVLLAATALLCIRVGRWGPGGILLAMLLGPSLFAVSAGGNVQALMLLGLLGWPSRRWGPAWVAVAASLKLTPILLVLVYVRRGAWVKSGVAIGLTALLVLPGLWLGLLGSASGVASGWGESLLGTSAVLYVAVVLAATAAVLVVPDRFGPLSAATAAVLALPRLFVYDSTLLVAGVDEDTRGPRDAGPGQRIRP
jgi:hypothetical protein